MPVLPVAVPGAAVSPGINTCNFTNGPALTVTAGLVLTATVVTALGVLAAFELGRMVTRDEEQREVEVTEPRIVRVRNAA